MISKKYIGVYLIFGVPLFVLIFIGSMNYSGFCFAKMKYLTYDEKVLIVFNINNQGKFFYKKTRVGGHTVAVESFEKIPYRSFEHYQKENPNCCEVRPSKSDDSPERDFFDSITGFHSGEVITINFKYRYYDVDGTVKVWDGQSQRTLTNCGSSIN